MSHLNTKSFAPRTAPIKLMLALLFIATASASANATLPTDGDVKRSEKIIAKLRRLAEVTASHLGFGGYKAEIQRVYPGLFIDVADLRESDLKTHLTTAV